jgi:hypothetical protein
MTRRVAPGDEGDAGLGSGLDGMALGAGDAVTSFTRCADVVDQGLISAVNLTNRIVTPTEPLSLSRRHAVKRHG